MFFGVAFLTHISSILLLNAKNLSRHSNYASILYHLYQNKFAKATGSILILLNNLGICIAELTIFKESIRKLIRNFSENNPDVMDPFYTQPYMIIIYIALLELPLTLYKKMEKLKFFAFFGVSGIMIFVVSLVIHFFF